MLCVPFIETSYYTSTKIMFLCIIFRIHATRSIVFSLEVSIETSASCMYRPICRIICAVKAMASSAFEPRNHMLLCFILIMVLWIVTP